MGIDEEFRDYEFIKIRWLGLGFVTVFAINMNCLKCNSCLFISLTAIMLCNCTLQLIQCLLYI